MCINVCFYINQNHRIIHFEPDGSNNNINRDDESCSDQNFNFLVENFQKCTEKSADKMFANFYHHEFDGNNHEFDDHNYS